MAVEFRKYGSRNFSKFEDPASVAQISRPVFAQVPMR
jgi:hypothetical protein